jgi:hypothetical protein
VGGNDFKQQEKTTCRHKTDKGSPQSHDSLTSTLFMGASRKFYLPFHAKAISCSLDATLNHRLQQSAMASRQGFQVP